MRTRRAVVYRKPPESERARRVRLVQQTILQKTRAVYRDYLFYGDRPVVRRHVRGTPGKSVVEPADAGQIPKPSGPLSKIVARYTRDLERKLRRGRR